MPASVARDDGFSAWETFLFSSSHHLAVNRLGQGAVLDKKKIILSIYIVSLLFGDQIADVIHVNIGRLRLHNSRGCRPVVHSVVHSAVHPTTFRIGTGFQHTRQRRKKRERWLRVIWEGGEKWRQAETREWKTRAPTGRPDVIIYQRADCCIFTHLSLSLARSLVLFLPRPTSVVLVSARWISISIRQIPPRTAKVRKKRRGKRRWREMSRVSPKITTVCRPQREPTIRANEGNKRTKMMGRSKSCNKKSNNSNRDRNWARTLTRYKRNKRKMATDG